MEQSINSKFTIIVAPKEFDNGMYVLRNMTERSEKQLGKDDLFAELKKINLYVLNKIESSEIIGLVLGDEASG